MKVKDPKRIIMPGEATDVDFAVNELRAKEQLERNPMFQMLTHMQQQLSQTMAQQQVLLIRLQALTDYMAQSGLLLHQDLDETGKPISEPYTPNMAKAKIFEALVDDNTISLPTYGYTTYFAEYSIRTKFVAQLMGMVNQNQISFKDAIKHIEDFNNEPGRLAPISGMEFGLPTYLEQNPDNLSEEELDVIAAKFKLRKEVQPDDDEATEGSEEEELPVTVSPEV